MKMTEHARKRCRQRGITNAMAATVVAHADREAHCGGGCTALEISHERIARAVKTSVGIAPERLRDLVVVVNNAGHIVTVVRARGRSASRRYRRGLN